MDQKFIAAEANQDRGPREWRLIDMQKTADTTQ